MAKYAAKGTRIYLDNHDVSGFLNNSEQTLTQEVPIVTCFSDDGPRRVVNNYDVEHGDLGLFDGDASSIDEIIHALLGSSADHYLTKMWGVSAEGGIAYDSIVELMNKPESAQLAGAVMLNWNTRGSGGVSRGNVLMNATVTGAGNRSGVNQGAKLSGPAYRVIIRVLSLTGTNIVLKVQQSSDDGGGDAYADIAGLTSGTLTGPGLVVVQTTAALEAYRRINISTPGGFTNAIALVTAGVVAGSA